MRKDSDEICHIRKRRFNTLQGVSKKLHFKNSRSQGELTELRKVIQTEVTPGDRRIDIRELYTVKNIRVSFNEEDLEVNVKRT